MEFKLYDIVCDLESKDIIKITNGFEVDGKFIPTEGMALRIAGFSKTKRGFYPKIAMTYRKFPEGSKYLSLANDSNLFKRFFTADEEGELQPKYRAGRI